MTLTEIKKRCLEIMKARYPTSKYKYYSNAVIESFKRPCFFTEISLASSEPASSGAEHYAGQFSIEILQDVVDEEKALEIANTLRIAFGRYFIVNADGGKKRAVRVNAYDFDFAGTDDNIPVITIDLEWFDTGLIPSETADIMDGIEVSIKVDTED